jgi:CoA-transferase family III
MTGPLIGIRVLEIGHMLTGPYCGLLLGDLGADLIKIEPSEGDIARKVSPHFIGPHNEYFASLNGNKRSVVIDLGPSGQEQLRALARGSYALVTKSSSLGHQKARSRPIFRRQAAPFGRSATRSRRAAKPRPSRCPLCSASTIIFLPRTRAAAAPPVDASWRRR